MAAETFRIEIPVRVDDQTEPGVGSATRKVNGFDRTVQQTQERLDRMNRTRYEVAVEALDKASSVIGRIGTSLKGIAGKAWRITMNVLDKATAPIRGVINLLKNPILQAGAILGISVGLKDTIDTYATFEATMSKVKAVSGATAEQMELLTTKAKEMGSTTKFTASEAGEAFTYMAMAGWDAQQMMDGMLQHVNGDGLRQALGLLPKKDTAPERGLLTAHPQDTWTPPAERTCYNCGNFFTSYFCGYNSCNCKIYGSLDVDQHERHPDTAGAECQHFWNRNDTGTKEGAEKEGEGTCENLRGEKPQQNKQQYHVIHTDGSSSVYGWVNASDIQAIGGSSAGSGSTETVYTVVHGDSLWAIAERFLGAGSRYTEIKEANGLKDNTIYSGQKLKIPGAAGGTAAPAEPAKKQVTKGSTVRLKKGAKTYTGQGLASFVYERDHIVKEISGDRAVITYGGVVVAAVHTSDLTVQ